MYSYDDIFLFIKIVELGNFINTAKRLKVSVSTISRKIKLLEDELGINLVRRNTKEFELTEQGKQMYNSFKGDLVNFDKKISDIVKVEKNNPFGTINVSLPPVLALNLITPYLPGFLRKYPEINLNIAYQSKEVNLVKEGIDVAIVNHIPAQQTVKVKKIFTATIRIFCTKEYIKKYGEPKTLGELKKHLVAGMMLENYVIPSNIEAINQYTKKTYMFEMPKRITINNATQSLFLLQSHEIIAGGFDFMLDFLNGTRFFEEQLIPVLPEYYFGNQPYYLIKHPNEKDLKIKVFCDFLEALLKQIKAKVSSTYNVYDS
ncbi:LysR family transcriptional regulator [Aquella oligotrophica]|uniref:HTH lysR-type domain-containing protein n=1 Tax=Aquella oligotrophica TaxID=2067065 RepID=A0A2I7N8C1_9NEIS|nr:LysR family transcriptional regulator [Aquella oligotrophica]AUR52709.1 hypothetical protein CUN60_10510 [Aquella oligotrophica]